MAKQRWNCKTDDYVEDPKVDAFLKDIEEVCKKHNMSISHEDDHGAFIIESLNKDNIKWLKAAMVNNIS